MGSETIRQFENIVILILIPQFFYILMQADLKPILKVLPFDEKYALEAQISIDKEAQAQYVSKTFLMVILQIRSGMTQEQVIVLRKKLLDMFEQALQRGGLTGVGFVINENYYTIRQPNYEGIKDLLTNNMRICESVDFLSTLVCLRHSIMNEAKKMENAKISLLFFTSCVAVNALKPLKISTQIIKNKHLPNYKKQMQRIKNVIMKSCVDSHCYIIGYSNLKKGNVEFIENTHLSYFQEIMYYFTDVFDASIFYQFAYCSHLHIGYYSIAESYNKLAESFQKLVSLLLYERHNFSLMVPIKSSFEGLMKKQGLLEMKYNEQRNEEEFEEQEIDMLEQQEFQLQNQSEEIKYFKIDLTNSDETIFKTRAYSFFDQKELDLKHLHDQGYHLMKQIKEKKPMMNMKKKILKKLKAIFEPQFSSKNVDYHEPSMSQLIFCQVQYYQRQIQKISSQLLHNIISYKRKEVDHKKFEYVMEVNEDLQFRLRQRILHIEQVAKKIYETIFTQKIMTKSSQKRTFFELYSCLKKSVDSINQTLMKILKKEVKNQDIGRLSQMINYSKVRASIRRKLIKRINGNPKMLDQISQKIQDICLKQYGDYVQLQAMYHQKKSELGRCMYTDSNFVKALKNRDCLCLVFEVERPDTAIMDPGRIRIRQISPMVTCANKFFQINQFGVRDYEVPTQKEIQNKMRQFGLKKWEYRKYLDYKTDKKKHRREFIPHKINLDVNFLKEVQEEEREFLKKVQRLKYEPVTNQKKLQRGEADLREYMNLQKQNYQEMWDYWDRVSRTQTSLGIMPLYVGPENWKVAKLMMKPCLAWTACGQPLGYTFSQYQTIPFMVLSFLIRHTQQIVYKISEKEVEIEHCKSEEELYILESERNKLQLKHLRFEQLLYFVEETCNVIMKELSQPHFEEKLYENVTKKFINYKNPINRTIDVINNNASFMGQLYCSIGTGFIQKPKQSEFHEFFKRMVEEELRRQTDGWNEEEVQDRFVNKLLNIKVQQMEKPEYIIMGSIYKDRFEEALEGKAVLKTGFEIERENLEMMLKQNNQFNDTQKMLLIQYKRLYENRVIWLWYIRFLLYEERERVSIHKWKCLDLANSYMLFTLIIQNKKQRKNYKRRQAIQQNMYADPFDYYAARKYLQEEFVRMRNQKEKKNIQILFAQKYRSSSTAFIKTPDIDEAAGALLNVGIGQQIKYYYEQLLTGTAVKVQEKLKLMLNGEHKGVQLMKTGWKMSKSRLRRLQMLYPIQFSRYRYMI